MFQRAAPISLFGALPFHFLPSFLGLTTKSSRTPVFSLLIDLPALTTMASNQPDNLSSSDSDVQQGDPQPDPAPPVAIGNWCANIDRLLRSTLADPSPTDPLGVAAAQLAAIEAKKSDPANVLSTDGTIVYDNCAAFEGYQILNGASWGEHVPSRRRMLSTLLVALNVAGVDIPDAMKKSIIGTSSIDIWVGYLAHLERPDDSAAAFVLEDVEFGTWVLGAAGEYKDAIIDGDSSTPGVFMFGKPPTVPSDAAVTEAQDALLDEFFLGKGEGNANPHWRTSKYVGLDARSKGNAARFIRHMGPHDDDAVPNVGRCDVDVPFGPTMVLFYALRDIKAGEELVWDPACYMHSLC